jgi:hypothetical protein
MAEFTWGLLGSKAARNVEQHEADSTGMRGQTMRRIRRACVRERPALRAFLAANALWELSLAALKTFVDPVPYDRRGLKMTRRRSSRMIGDRRGR